MTDSSTDHHFITKLARAWHRGEVAECHPRSADSLRWWPPVYLAVREIQPPDDRGLHQRVRLHTKGWLPYTPAVDFEVTESRYPERLASMMPLATLAGRGLDHHADGDEVNVN